MAIVQPDSVKFKEILEELAKAAFHTDVGTQSERAERQLGREMLAFTESNLGVPYQLRILKVVMSTWLKKDLINSLARSETLDAATGLAGIIEDPSFYKEDVRPEVVDAVYRLRETGKAEIINATNDFVAKYERPVLPADVPKPRSVEKQAPQELTKERPAAVTTKAREQQAPIWSWASFFIGVAGAIGAVWLVFFLKKRLMSGRK